MIKIARDGAEIGEYDTFDEIYEQVATGAMQRVTLTFTQAAKNEV